MTFTVGLSSCAFSVTLTDATHTSIIKGLIHLFIALFRLLNYTKVRTLLFLLYVCLCLSLYPAVGGAQLVSVTGTGILSACDAIAAPASYTGNFDAGLMIEPLPYASLGLSRATAIIPVNILRCGMALQGMASDQWLQLRASCLRPIPLTRQFTVGLAGHLAWERAAYFSSHLTGQIDASIRIELDAQYVLGFAINNLLSTEFQTSPTVVIGGSVVVGPTLSADVSLTAKQNVLALFIVRQNLGQDFSLRTYLQTLPIQLGLGVRGMLETDVALTLDVRMIMHLGLRTAICLEFR